ncbi:hypothetical protein H6G00_00940 [Leptolyngbya sp. FACHB-541]|nr:hypothetical protein [Leptolyngbya sp. FACHB-541]
MRRKHCNPPIWTDTHFHNFQITLHLQAVRGVSAMYGIDMIEVEMLLKAWAEALPEVVNEHPLCIGGTTEDLCLYFARIELDPHIQLLRVDVAETPERITSLPILQTTSLN